MSDLSSAIHNTGHYYVRPRPVLLNSTGRGTLGRVAYYQLSEPAVCDNHVTILRPNTKICDPCYLALFLNSPAGVSQSERFQTGSSGQLEIYPKHIQQFAVFLKRTKSGKIDMDWQWKLADKVKLAIQAREEASKLISAATALVEQALLQFWQ
jgi:type I restriction enzyme S subunit